MSANVIFNESFTDKILKIELNNLSKKNALSLEMLAKMTLKLSQNNYIKKFINLIFIFNNFIIYNEVKGKRGIR